MPKNPPIALILFSNDLDHFLPSVERERKMIEEALEQFNDSNRLKVIARSSVGVEEVFRLFSRYKGRIALFHFAGHAGGDGLQLNRDFEDIEMGKAVGLVDLFRREATKGLLQLVFLNGCSTQPQLALLKEAGVPSVISTHCPIEDEKALHFAQQFYRTFANAEHPQPFAHPPTIAEAFEQAMAYLKTLHEATIQKTNRDFVIHFSGKTAIEEAWTLYSSNPSWALSFDVAEEGKPFNELLALQLLKAIEPHSLSAQKFLSKAREIAGWESVTRISDKAKDIIAYSFVGVLGIQLRKLFAIGKEPLSEDKQRKYLFNCLLTARRALQLVCFLLLSKLWDLQKEHAHHLSRVHRQRLRNFFEDEFELDIQGYIDLLQSLFAVFSDNKLELPLEELPAFAPKLEANSEFLNACIRFQEINVLLDKSQYELADCFAAERQLSTVLSALHFLASYKMISIKNIAYDEMRNSPPRYLHSYAALGIDSKFNVNSERVNYAEAPINTDAILLFKGRYQQSINLFPFIIDVNTLTFEGGAKVCFYSCQDIADGSLNYRFLEDNSLENIIYKKTLTDGGNLNQLMTDPQKRKDYKLDFVFLQFQDAKKTILQSGGKEGEEDFFAGEEDFGF